MTVGNLGLRETLYRMLYGFLAQRSTVRCSFFFATLIGPRRRFGSRTHALRCSTVAKSSAIGPVKAGFSFMRMGQFLSDVSQSTSPSRHFSHHWNCSSVMVFLYEARPKPVVMTFPSSSRFMSTPKNTLPRWSRTSGIHGNTSKPFAPCTVCFFIALGWTASQLNTPISLNAAASSASMSAGTVEYIRIIESSAFANGTSSPSTEPAPAPAPAPAPSTTATVSATDTASSSTVTVRVRDRFGELG